MTDQPKSKVKRWVYPFTATGGKEIDDPQIILDALSFAQDGSYPIGDNGLWHGGVHFDAGTAAALAQDAGVRCIADGEVVAYRLDDTYPQIEYPDGKKALYSTGFVLVRHRLELPPPPQTAAPADVPPVTAAPTRPAEQPALTFFSLYMHLLNWAAYKTEVTRSRPAHWKGEVTAYVAGDHANDVEEALAPGMKGERIKNESNVTIGLIPKGTRITLGTPKPDKPSYFALTGVVAGDTAPPGISTGYVYKEELTPINDPDADALGNVFALSQPLPIAAGALIGHLGEYGRYDDATLTPPMPSRPLLHLEVFTGDDISDFIAQSRARAAQLDASQKTILVINRGAKLCQPVAADKQLSADIAVTALSGKETGEGPWVKVQPLKKQIVLRTALTDYKSAGSAHGSYSYGDFKRVPFTGLYFGATETEFTTEETEAKKRNYTRREIQAPDGAAVWIEKAALNATATERKAWNSFPLRTATTTTPEVDCSRSLSKTQINKLPSNSKAKDDHGNAWYRVEVGAATSNTEAGWVCDKAHPQTQWKSPWDWPGFEVLMETAQPLELYSRKLDQLGAAADVAEAQSLKAKAETADRGAVLTELRKSIDAQGNKDGKVDGDELRKALRLPWLAEPITKLIVRYESEWAGSMGKWDELDPLIKGGLPIWQEEKKRIQKLQWWDNTKAIARFPQITAINHLHSEGVISNFAGSNADCDCINDITEAQLRFISTTATLEDLTSYTPEINKMFDKFKISKCINRAHLLAQMLHESGSFKYTKELGRNLSYDPWRGRGLIQITGKENYQSYGAYVGEDTISEPGAFEKLENLPHSVLSAGWYWVEYKIITGDADQDDFIWCTAAVNGAFNGYNDRLKYLNRCIAALEISSCAIKNHAGDYLFEESKIYSNRRFSFAWGLWHDPNSGKEGVTKAKEKAIAGYQRYLDLHEHAGRPTEPTVRSNGTKQYWYGLRENSYREYAEQRLNVMKSS